MTTSLLTMLLDIKRNRGLVYDYLEKIMEVAD